MVVYKLFWDEFSSWYLEAIKPAYQKPIDSKTLAATEVFFDKLLKLLHPFMPFITEELWQLLEERKDGESIMISDMPVANGWNKEIEQHFEKLKEVVTHIRSIRKDKNIPNKDELKLYIRAEENKYDKSLDNLAVKLANLSELILTEDKVDDAISFMVGTSEYFIPLEGNIDVEEELKKLEEELKYQKGFLNSVSKKLSNEKFVNNAPQKVVDIERQKQADAEIRIKAIEEQINLLK